MILISVGSSFSYYIYSENRYNKNFEFLGIILVVPIKSKNRVLVKFKKIQEQSLFLIQEECLLLLNNLRVFDKSQMVVVFIIIPGQLFIIPDNSRYYFVTHMTDCKTVKNDRIHKKKKLCEKKISRNNLLFCLQKINTISITINIYQLN